MANLIDAAATLQALAKCHEDDETNLVPALRLLSRCIYDNVEKFLPLYSGQE
ncbi:hypothetical protein ACI3L3_11765 [Desulfobaculum sp. SPO524]|uniref:hypothetical protein n=1 Tax=Desulfobaculum sp. SPO524 TaxID=3378071 RepID=UPI0038524EA3